MEWNETEVIYLKSLKTLSDNCRTLRIARRWTPFTLSAEANVSLQTIYNIENGAGNITIKILESVAFALGVTSIELLGNKTQ